MEADLFHGEEVIVLERVIVAPMAGRFHPVADGGELLHESILTAGQTIGYLVLPGETRPVPSPFAGQLMGVLALAGERVRAGQPLAWLRVG